MKRYDLTNLIRQMATLFQNGGYREARAKYTAERVDLCSQRRSQDFPLDGAQKTEIQAES